MTPPHRIRRRRNLVDWHYYCKRWQQRCAAASLGVCSWFGWGSLFIYEVHWLVRWLGGEVLVEVVDHLCYCNAIATVNRVV